MNEQKIAIQNFQTNSHSGHKFNSLTFAFVVVKRIQTVIALMIQLCLINSTNIA